MLLANNEERKIRRKPEKQMSTSRKHLRLDKLELVCAGIKLIRGEEPMGD